MNEIILLAVVTNLGNFEIELYPKEAPVTVENFTQYVDDNFFENAYLIINGIQNIIVKSLITWCANTKSGS